MNNNEDINYKIGGQIWVQKDGENFMGPGRITILELLAEGYTLEEVAIKMKMKLETAINNINAINKTAKRPLTLTKDKNHYEVTSYGIDIISKYKELKEEHDKMLEELNKKFSINL
ncbi:hypothetical protein FJR48_11500 [Sulfurimonas lithotrophica]|uniref:Uncharacterized protein n=1 Tax=Sulfurimonas lithotrophica TaxID=2590022 RepID=A0A5P8P3Q8_9BACT|nr:hypothetical protein [Sulfurimonas lithotrophica]QFR50315.1 hypothetical protein FJR48_11500 [Sulfurimonas lithotrophica]